MKRQETFLRAFVTHILTYSFLAAILVWHGVISAQKSGKTVDLLGLGTWTVLGVLALALAMTYFSRYLDKNRAGAE